MIKIPDYIKRKAKTIGVTAAIGTAAIGSTIILSSMIGCGKETAYENSKNTLKVNSDASQVVIETNEYRSPLNWFSGRTTEYIFEGQGLRSNQRLSEIVIDSTGANGGLRLEKVKNDYGLTHSETSCDKSTALGRECLEKAATTAYPLLTDLLGRSGNYVSGNSK